MKRLILMAITGRGVGTMKLTATAGALTLVMLVALLLAAVQPVLGQTEVVLHSFHNNGTDGYGPVAGLIRDPKGNLYGTTPYGGTYGSGTVFELTSSDTEKILHSFHDNGTDGTEPLTGLVRDTKGNLYGTTYQGGAHTWGTVFELTPSGTETILYSFDRSGTGGYFPQGLVRDTKGNLYGTTEQGGTYGFGTVFELTPSGTETVLHSFGQTASDGFYPVGGPVMDTNGNLYGTTYSGGAHGVGTVYEVTSSGNETVLYSFGATAADGNYPQAGLVRDTAGNLYGTTFQGGASSVGTVFELTPSGTETILHSFGETPTDGTYPEAALVRDRNGNLYSTTQYGGAYTYGTVFELTPSGTETILHNFDHNKTDGIEPGAGLVLDTKGNFYGTTALGGTYHHGTIFEVTP